MEIAPSIWSFNDVINSEITCNQEKLLYKSTVKKMSLHLYTHIKRSTRAIFITVSSDKFAGPFEFSTNLCSIQNPDYLAPFYLHVWSTFVRVQTSHLTSQHQRNMQLQRSRTMQDLDTYPLPQHNRSQPSIPIDVALHSRPYVPGKSMDVSFSQYEGDESK